MRSTVRIAHPAVMGSKTMRRTTPFIAVVTGLVSMGIPAAPAAAVPGDIRTVAQLGSCMLQAHHSTSVRLLDSLNAHASDSAFAKLQDETTCADELPADSMLDDQLSRFSKGLMRGMIAEAALRGSSSASALQPLPLEQKGYVRPWFAATGRDPSVDEMATCIADTDPAGIAALIATAPNSESESRALSDIQPWLGKCLSANTTLHADRTALRAALADALYQRVRDPALSLPQQAKTENSH